MNKLYLATVRLITLLIAIIAIDNGVVMAMYPSSVNDTTKSKSTKISDTRPFRPSFASASTKSDYIPLKRVSNAVYSGIPVSKGIQADPGDLLNLKIYPIPVADQINMSYHLSKDSNVLIEIMDVLGVKISTLLSQRKPAGEQKETFQITSKLNSGIYFIRVIAGSQQAIKRISVL